MAAEPFIHTLGHPELRRADGAPAGELRRKDLALLAYLAVEGARTHPRTRLASLLWGESTESRGRHSLTQALGRLQRALGEGALAVEKQQVRWHAAVPSDAAVLLADDPWHPRVDDALTLYAEPFLEGFDAGAGAEEFAEWADRRRPELRSAALRVLVARGEEAEEAGEWDRALRIGEREVDIDPLGEQGHRRVMRALRARGEPNRALRHYRAFEAWLDETVGGEPDRETSALADEIAAEAEGRPAPAVPEEPAWRPREHPGTPFTPPTAVQEARCGDCGRPLAPPPPPVPAESAESPATEDAKARRPRRRPPLRPRPARRGRRRVFVFVIVFASLVAVVSSGFLWSDDFGRIVDGLGQGPGAVAGGSPDQEPERRREPGPRRERGARPTAPREPDPGYGESIGAGDGEVYLAFDHTLYRYPDAATLARCLGPYPGRVRRVERLPAWPRGQLASVLEHPWQGDTLPVVTDDPVSPTQHVAVGCVLAPVESREGFAAIFGHRVRERSVMESDTVLHGQPAVFKAGAFPVRPAGTLIRGVGDSLRWVVFHGGALRVPGPEVLASYCRSVDEAVQVGSDEFHYYRAWAVLPTADPPCRSGE